MKIEIVLKIVLKTGEEEKSIIFVYPYLVKVVGYLLLVTAGRADGRAIRQVEHDVGFLPVRKIVIIAFRTLSRTSSTYCFGLLIRTSNKSHITSSNILHSSSRSQMPAVKILNKLRALREAVIDRHVHNDLSLLQNV
jgi:hypothetical protein